MHAGEDLGAFAGLDAVEHELEVAQPGGDERVRRGWSHAGPPWMAESTASRNGFQVRVKVSRAVRPSRVRA